MTVIQFITIMESTINNDDEVKLPNLHNIRNKILEIIDSGALYKVIFNCKSLHGLSLFFNITTTIKQYIDNNNDINIEFDFLIKKVDEIKSVEQLNEILNIDYWCKKNLEDIDALKNNINPLVEFIQLGIY